jgi:hypothetical protein
MSTNSKEYARQHYEANKDAYKKRAKINNKLYRARNRQNMVDYLLNNPCVDCGEADIIVLDFDHLRDKTMNVTRLVNNSISWATILKEIDKCEVVCSNCHRRRTAARHGSWYKVILRD